MLSYAFIFIKMTDLKTCDISLYMYLHIHKDHLYVCVQQYNVGILEKKNADLYDDVRLAI